MTEYRKKRTPTLFLVQFSLLAAIEWVMCFTILGSIPVGPLVATLAMVPVIITGILLGTGPGAAMGLIAGFFSFYIWTFTPPSFMAFVFTPFYSIGDISGNFWSLVICFVPRILVGVVASLSFRALSRGLTGKKDFFAYAISGILGSLTNTFLVLGGIYVFFGQEFASINQISYNLLLGTLLTVVATNGLLEAGISAVAAYAVCRPLKRYILH